MTAPARVLVIGAGPAGLAAATRLLEAGRDRVRVKLVHMGHHLGGKAASYPDHEGRTMEHGWHMLVGFYHRTFALMRRAGIDLGKTIVSMGGQGHPYESFDGRIHTLDGNQGRLEFGFDFLGYDGLPVGDRLNYARFMAQAYLNAFNNEDLTRHDDLCFRTWAIEHGLRPHITRYSLFRFLQEAYFNYPESISAYHVLQSLRLMSSADSAEMFVVRGGFTDKVWDPIGAYFTRLGGTIEPYVLAADWLYEGRQIVGVRMGQPDALKASHGADRMSWPDSGVPLHPDTVFVYRNFDYVISTIPHAVLVGMNRSDSGGSPTSAPALRCR